MALLTQEDIKQGVPAGANIVKRVNAPGGGQYLLDDLGGVYGVNGATAFGSYHSYGDSAKNNPNRRFTDLRVNPDGSYQLLANDGAHYDIDNPTPYVPPKRKLEEDPAWLAFVRGSDYAVDSAAADAAKAASAISSSLILDKDKLNEDNRRALDSIDTNYASRGVFHGGGRLYKRDLQESDKLRSLGNMESKAAQDIGNVETGLARTIADQQRMGAETAAKTDTSYTQDDITKYLDNIRRSGDQKYSDTRRQMLQYS